MILTFTVLFAVVLVVVFLFGGVTTSSSLRLLFAADVPTSPKGPADCKANLKQGALKATVIPHVTTATTNGKRQRQQQRRQ